MHATFTSLGDRPSETITPEAFVKRMDDHWRNELGNATSDALKATWAQIANVFKVEVEEHNHPYGRQLWRVLSPPTGAGKTESIVIYCSMLAELPDTLHPGALIVTRRIADCNNIADRINKFGSRETAVAFHSDSPVDLRDLHQYPVVTITHRAYELALDKLGKGSEIRCTWPFFHIWDAGEEMEVTKDSIVTAYLGRKLVVIDESLDVLEQSLVSLEGLRKTVGTIPSWHWDKFKDDYRTIQWIIETLLHCKEMSTLKNTHTWMAVRNPITDAAPPDLTDLVASLDELTFDRKDKDADRRSRDEHKARLKELHILFRSWSFYMTAGRDHQLHTARLLIPEGIKGAVVMDATAQVNKVFGLADFFKPLKQIPGARNYRNVTMHVSKGNRTGKGFLSQNAQQCCSDLVQTLGERLKDKKVFICCHKAVEPMLNKFQIGAEMQTAHWGNIDGSNQWRDCDTAIIMGLPHMPPSWAPGVYMALKGPQPVEWMLQSQDIRRELEAGQMATSVIQAINRIRCRKTINENGDCDLADVYLMLPDGSMGDEILDLITDSMTGVQVKFDFEMTTHKRLVKGSKHLEALVSYVKNFDKTKVTVKQVAGELGIGKSRMKELIQTIDDEESPLRLAMEKASVVYTVERKGKTQRAYFVK